MPIPLDEVAAYVTPNRTVLLFGAGASIPSGAPSSQDLIKHYSQNYGLPSDLTLGEVTQLAQKKTSRLKIIRELRDLLKPIRVSGGLLSIPKWNWKSIFTTNYDNLLEQAYEKSGKQCRIISSNFDFQLQDGEFSCDLFKIHGTIEKDECDGHQSKLILTSSDYSQTEEYREYLYDRLRGDLAGSDLIIIGQSLSDPDMQDIVSRAIRLNEKLFNPARITLLAYQADEYRAELLEMKGLRVAFGGIDEFTAVLARANLSSTVVQHRVHDALLANANLSSEMIDVADESDESAADVSAMFNGWPASHAEIAAGLTFERDIVRSILDYCEEDGSLCVTVLGAAGVGKSTAARQSLQALRRAGYRCWEHRGEKPLDASGWRQVGAALREQGLVGALLVDEAHLELGQVNSLVDLLAADDNVHLKIILVSTKSQWNFRTKTPNIFKLGKTYRMSVLSTDEIDRLLNLIERQPPIRELVEASFAGFSRNERRRRLQNRCEADMFVCLKNIFASEAFDDIILREFAGLPKKPQEVYRYVAAMETAGVRVHRQLVIRLLDVGAGQIESVIRLLDDIVEEYTVNDRLGIYGWRCRHHVISAIITKYKFSDTSHIVSLFDDVIGAISPTYDIEIRTLRELCNSEGGISKIPDKNVQNRLLRRMVSMAPAERIPRHRLIRNLIDQGEFEKAETEIRVFNNDFGVDGPVHRYKIRLMTARASRTPGILDEDRVVILEKAQELAVAGVARFPNNKSILGAYAELGIEYFRRTGSYDYFDAAMNEMHLAEDRSGDPDITAMIGRFERRLAGSDVGETVLSGGQ